MRSLLWLLAVFAAAVALVILGRVDAGYVLFVYPPYRVEVTMIFFAIAVLLGFFLLYGLVRLMSQVLSLPASVRTYRKRRRRERAHSALARALQAYYEGRYRRAEREAALAYETGPVPGIAALLAARAAHQLRDFASRERWLERADGAGALGLAARARATIEKALAADWSSRLVTLYAELPSRLGAAERAEEAGIRIERGGRWLTEHGRAPELLARLGRLCVQGELWGK